MLLDCVLTAVNENPLYLKLIPNFIKFWNKFYPNVDVKIILISENIPENLILYKNNFILFKPITNMSTIFISQFIRNLYPCILNYTNGVIITDIDNYPMNNTFFTKNIKDISQDKWINLRNWVTHKKPGSMICMMWQVATPKVWKEVFNINNLQDINKTLTSVYSELDTTVYNNINSKKKEKNKTWHIDQLFLYKKVMSWNKKTNKYIALNDKNTKHKRLDRLNFLHLNDIIKDNIINGTYSDYHCHRSNDKYFKLNDEIYNLVDKI